MSFIELTNIRAGYVKGTPILNNFNLSVEKGELLSLLGPSGCGKTTTLRTIAGFIMAEQGRVVIDGKDYSKVPPNKRNIGLVFQNYALFPHLSVFDNVAYGLRRRKVTGDEMAGRIEKVLEMVSLSGYEKRLPAQLSGGQRQRVALARSIVIEPDLLLLDEPLSNLDAKLRDEMRAELSRLQHQLGITMIYVTHDQIEALSLSSRIVVMNEGRIEQMGKPEEIYENPATSFVARFVGFDNSLQGLVADCSEKSVSVNVSGGRMQCPLPSGRKYESGDRVDMYFRPDDVILGGESSDNSLPVSINFATYQGNTILYSLSAGGSALSAVIAGNRQKFSGDCHMTVPPEKIKIERSSVK